MEEMIWADVDRVCVLGMGMDVKILCGELAGWRIVCDVTELIVIV